MDESTALQRALVLAGKAGRTSPNPKVGCVIIDSTGTVVGEGFHRGAGSPHAEVEALREAGGKAAGATAVVTLEPCNHTGRTGPCTQALIRAGVARVIIGRRDPNTQASGGIEALRAHGIEATVANPDPSTAQSLTELNRYWEIAVRLGRPAVVWKTASTLDARVAAPDGTCRWITGPEARREVHELRAALDAVMVGTGTALADDPALTVRGMPAEQPLRVVVGARRLPPEARVLDDSAPTMLIPDHEPALVLARLWDAGVRSVLLEGGPTLAARFLAEGLVDSIVWFTAPLLLGAGTPAVAELGIPTLAGAFRFQATAARIVGRDIRVDLVKEA